MFINKIKIIMNILIVAKEYSSKSKARAIQMRRVIESLINYTEHAYYLITANYNGELINGNIKTYSVEDRNYNKIDVFFEKIICTRIAFSDNEFIKLATQASSKLINEFKIDIIMTVSTPIESHIVGKNIKKNSQPA